jgi:hypothetical protein
MTMYIKALETLGPDMKLPKNMSELWEKAWTKPGFDPSKSYLEALKQFTETWQNMWKK